MWWYGRRPGPALRYICGPSSKAQTCLVPVVSSITSPRRTVKLRPPARDFASSTVTRYPARFSS